jgi:hypothetical protein
VGLVPVAEFVRVLEESGASEQGLVDEKVPDEREAPQPAWELCLRLGAAQEDGGQVHGPDPTDLGVCGVDAVLAVVHIVQDPGVDGHAIVALGHGAHDADEGEVALVGGALDGVADGVALGPHGQVRGGAVFLAPCPPVLFARWVHALEV